MTDEQIQTFVDLIEWAEMLDAEHPANVAQRIEKEIDWILDAEAVHADWLDNERTMREAGY